MDAHNTRVWLLSVPWDIQLSNVFDWNSAADFRNYMRGGRQLTTPFYVVRNGQSTLNVNAPLEDCLNFNYVYVEQGQPTKGPAQYCFFLVNADYVSPTVTALTIEMDYYNTYWNVYKVNECFIERQHENRVFQANGKVYYDYDYAFIPEDIEVGSEYTYQPRKFISQTDPEIYFLWWTVADDNTVNVIDSYYGVYSPLSVNMIPFVRNKQGTQIQIREKDANGYEVIRNIATLSEVSKELTKKATAVTSIFITKYTPIEMSFEPNGSMWFARPVEQSDPVRPFRDVSTTSLTGVSPYPKYFQVHVTQENIIHSIGRVDAPRFTSPTATGGGQVTLQEWQTDNPLFNQHDTKAHIWPYEFMKIELNRGNSIVIKPQFCTGASIPINYYVAIGEQFKEGYAIAGNYLVNSGYTDVVENMAVSSATQEFPVVSDTYAEYMRQNRASMQATLAVAQDNSVINGISGVMGSALGGASSVGMLMSFGHPALGAVAGLAALGSVGMNIAKNIANVEHTEWQLAAKKEDLRNAPDSLKQPGNNFVFENAVNYNGVSYVRAQIPATYRQYITNVFTRTGWLVNKYGIPDTKSRKFWNYVRTRGAKITGTMPKVAQDRIAAMYDNGVTFWHNPMELNSMYDYNHHNWETFTNA